MVGEASFAVTGVVEAVGYDDRVRDDWCEVNLAYVSCRFGYSRSKSYTVALMLPPSRLPVRLLIMLKALPTTVPLGS